MTPPNHKEDCVPRAEYDAHKEYCDHGWRKVDEIHEAVHGLRTRYMVLVAVLASLATFFASNPQVAKLLLVNLASFGAWG